MFWWYEFCHFDKFFQKIRHSHDDKLFVVSFAFLRDMMCSCGTNTPPRHSVSKIEKDCHHFHSLHANLRTGISKITSQRGWLTIAIEQQGFLKVGQSVLFANISNIYPLKMWVTCHRTTDWEKEAMEGSNAWRLFSKCLDCLFAREFVESFKMPMTKKFVKRLLGFIRLCHNQQ